jgi:hypothetical protein
MKRTDIIKYMQGSRLNYISGTTLLHWHCGRPMTVFKQYTLEGDCSTHKKKHFLPYTLICTCPNCTYIENESHLGGLPGLA